MSSLHLPPTISYTSSLRINWVLHTVNPRYVSSLPQVCRCYLRLLCSLTLSSVALCLSYASPPHLSPASFISWLQTIYANIPPLYRRYLSLLTLFATVPISFLSPSSLLKWIQPTLLSHMTALRCHLRHPRDESHKKGGFLRELPHKHSMKRERRIASSLLNYRPECRPLP